MGVDRVWRLFDELEVDRQARLFGLSDDGGIGLDCARFAAEFAFQIGAAIHAASGHFGVQLKRMPFDDERVVGHLL